MMAWITTAFSHAGYQPVALPFAFLLGLGSAAVSTCCTLPVLGMVVGYSGSRGSTESRTTAVQGAAFMVGTVASLLILGLVAGFVGQLAQTTLGRYWKIFAGFVAILAGLATLDLLPLSLPQVRRREGGAAGPAVGAALFGLILGGAVSVVSLGCNPGIYIVLGAAVLQGYTLWMFAILLAYAVGFSLPLTALVVGVSFGAVALRAQRAERWLRTAGAALMVGVGIYFLATV
jgi:cytochrome c biogenesis protein CcdA